MADDMVTTERRKAVDRLRIDADPESVEKGLVTLVLTLVELLRQLMERQALSRLAGRSEWGVKAYVAMPDDGAEGQQPVTDDPASGPGAAYLRRRRAQLAAHRDARQEAVASAQAVHAELDRLSASARLYPPQSPEIAGHSGMMVLNAAYLVADNRAEGFGAAVTELAARHGALQLTLTGPWPAYSFVGQDGTQDVR